MIIPLAEDFSTAFYLEERKNCATALAGHRVAILFNRDLVVLLQQTVELHLA
ncbi:hypothetical protein QMP26_16150 [Enterocloster clostridioformis]|uniref:hypothetical protein n=1 Tax=Enterocloster clostridioformis TaxID=1531 RepID=UPI0026772900|nr:hypothetical protein [Enterocloster clostridioformis]